MRPKYVVIDSIQTTISSELTSPPGTISQIRDVTYELMNHIKANNITCFIIGHITKEGSIAGPKILEHMVDTVIYFEGDQFRHYRLLRAIKNRFGNGRRTTQRLDPNRLSMLIAVIEKYFDITLADQDFYINVVGGLKLVGRDSDLSLMASILSSFQSKSIDPSIFLGEVGLTGEVRSVGQMDIRLKEMEQLNYRKLITSQKAAKEYQGKFEIEIIGLKKASDLEHYL